MRSTPGLPTAGKYPAPRHQAARPAAANKGGSIAPEIVACSGRLRLVHDHREHQQDEDDQQQRLRCRHIKA
jgi:hypothetical protein